MTRQVDPNSIKSIPTDALLDELRCRCSGVLVPTSSLDQCGVPASLATGLPSAATSCVRPGVASTENCVDGEKDENHCSDVEVDGIGDVPRTPSKRRRTKRGSAESSDSATSSSKRRARAGRCAIRRAQQANMLLAAAVPEVVGKVSVMPPSSCLRGEAAEFVPRRNLLLAELIMAEPEIDRTELLLNELRTPATRTPHLGTINVRGDAGEVAVEEHNDSSLEGGCGARYDGDNDEPVAKSLKEAAAVQIQCFVRGCLARKRVLHMKSCPSQIDSIISSMISVSLKAEALGPPYGWKDRDKQLWNAYWEELYDLCEQFGASAGIKTTPQDTARVPTALFTDLQDLDTEDNDAMEEFIFMLSRQLRSRMDMD